MTQDGYMTQNDDSYGVEVSGWDASENFFVEQALLDWHRDGTKEVLLRCPLREGCVVFVRLLRTLPSQDSFPIACKVVKASGGHAAGRTLVQLEQLRPRPFLDGLPRPTSYTDVTFA